MFKPGIIQYSTATPNGLLNNLVSYYKMDTDGSLIDVHGGDDGTINGATFTASGLINGGYSGDGINDYLTLGSAISSVVGNFSSDFSIFFWMKGSGTATHILSNTWATARYFYVRLDNASNVTRWAIADGSDTSLYGAVNMLDDVWHLQCMRFRASDNTFMLNIDDSAVVTSSSSKSTTMNNEPAVFARRTTTGIDSYNAITMDEVGIYNGLLTDEQVVSVYNSGAGISYDSFTS